MSFAPLESARTTGPRASSALLIALLTLAGCASTPMPPMRPLPPLPPVAIGPTPPAQHPAPSPVAPPAPPPSIPLRPPVPAAEPARAPSAGLPYSEAVAARFPDPPVRYDTPAFAAGHTGFTGNAELAAALQALVREGGGQGATVRMLKAGASSSGQPLQALLFSRETDLTPEALRQSARPTVLLIGQQHGDEPAPAEALLVIARQLAGGPLAPLLERINVIVWPRANPDGAERGQRSTSTGIDINRDHLLLSSPETQALAALQRDYQPVVVVDAHEYTVAGRWLEKFGGIQRPDAMLQAANTPNLHPYIARAAEEWFRRPLAERLQRAGLSQEWYHTTSNDPADKRVSMGGVRPDVGRNVAALRQSVSLLVETRGIGIGALHLQRRVHTHVVAASAVLAVSADRAADLAKLRHFVEADVAAQACQGELVVDAEPTPSEYQLRLIDPVTGADKPVSVAWQSALELMVTRRRPRPCGYWLAPTEAEAVRRLRALGVVVQQVEASGAVRGETWRERSRQVGARDDVRGSMADAQGAVRVEVEPQAVVLDVPAGSWYVGLDQPLAALAAAALEPDTQSSFFAHRVLGSLAGSARVMTLPELRTSPVP